MTLFLREVSSRRTRKICITGEAFHLTRVETQNFATPRLHLQRLTDMLAYKRYPSGQPCSIASAVYTPPESNNVIAGI